MFKRFGIIAVMTALFWGSGALANDVYIEQIGDGATVTITQDGTSNRVGAEFTPVIIKGDANVVTIDQIGSSNSLDMIINGAAVTATVTTNGSNNTQVIDCGTANSATCGSSFIKQEVTGDYNTVTQTLVASATQHSEILIAGDYNTVSHTTSGNAGHSGIITITGGVALAGVTTSGTGGLLNAVGTGGSGGANGTRPAGGLYGGGGGGCDDDTNGSGGNGAAGAVRLIWGKDLSFPSAAPTGIVAVNAQLGINYLTQIDQY